MPRAESRRSPDERKFLREIVPKFGESSSGKWGSMWNEQREAAKAWIKERPRAPSYENVGGFPADGSIFCKGKYDLVVVGRGSRDPSTLWSKLVGRGKNVMETPDLPPDSGFRLTAGLVGKKAKIEIFGTALRSGEWTRGYSVANHPSQSYYKNNIVRLEGGDSAEVCFSGFPVEGRTPRTIFSFEPFPGTGNQEGMEVKVSHAVRTIEGVKPVDSGASFRGPETAAGAVGAAA